jgi:high-affinity nickel-transport protein
MIVSAGLLGFVLGLQHATDADHLVAVATIVSRERRFSAGALVGVFWGLGHMVTLGLAGVVVIAFGLRVPPRLETGFELAVAVMLVTLGALRLRDAARGVGVVGREHLVTAHDHGGAEVVHSHVHAHDGGVHAHPHVHPSRRLLDVLRGHGPAVSVRAILVGCVHGMAGTAAVTLLVLATLPTAAAAVAYLIVFGVGTLAGMTALTAAMAYPIALALRVRRARQALAIAAGLASITFGFIYAARLW